MTSTEQEIFNDYCYLLECEMATLEYFESIKRTSKREICRHESIIENHLQCVRQYAKKGLVVDRKHSRVYEAIKHGWDT